MQPGERLVETRIAEELGVSRSTIREAFLKLEHQGLVVNHPRRGTFVTRLSQADALDLGYARALIEGFAVTIGHARVDEQVVAQLEGYLVEMSTCDLPEDLPRLFRIDLAFHRLLVETAHSSRLMDLWSSLSGQIGALLIRGVEHQHANIGDVVALHRRLLDTVRSPDPRGIQRAVFEHYVRLPPDSSSDALTMHQVIQSIAPNYIAATIERMNDDVEISPSRTDGTVSER
jgi:DNA-binding GntR family transcriptional regulator